MREIIPRPVLLAVTLMLVVGAVVFIELRLDTPGAEATSARANVEKEPEDAARVEGKTGSSKDASADVKKKAATSSSNDAERSEPAKRDASTKQGPAVSDAERIASKEDKYTRAREITGSTGLINTDGLSVKDAAGEKVVLVEFWTYSCLNCQNAQPHINALYDKYRKDGLLVVGVHSPEFGFEKDISNVREAVARENIEYPVVLDNNYAIWNAYDQRFWPAWYLIDADGFIRYRHFGEGAYEETDQKVQELLAERDRISG
jgi:thiol-disulfide isomerase/thioredoxin